MADELKSYKITDPATGRTIRIKGPRPPTQEDAAAIFAAQRSPKEEAVAARREGRLSAKQNFQAGLEEFLSNKGPMSPPMGALRMLGSGFQAAENVAAPALNELTGRPVPAGSPNMEFGDVYAGLGAPEWLAQTAGLLTPNPTNMARTGLNLTRAGLEAGKEAVLALPRAARAAAVKGSFILQGKPMEEIDYLVKNRFAPASGEHLVSGNIAANRVAGAAIQDAERIKKVSDAAWKRFGKAAASEEHGVDTAKTFGSILSRVAQDEVLPNVQKTILDLPIGERVVRIGPKAGRGISTQTEKIVFKPKSGEEIITTTKTKGNRALVETKGKKLKDGELVEELSKRVAKDIPPEQVGQKVVPYTLGNYIDDLNAGKPTTTRQLYAASQALDSLAQDATFGARAMKMNSELRKGLNAVSPSYKKASEIYSNRMNAEGAMEELFGGISEGMYTGKTGKNVANMERYFTTPFGSPLRSAAEELEQSVKSTLKESRGYPERVKAVAATRKLGGIRPYLSAATYGGLGAMGAGAMGLSTPAIAALGAIVGLSQSPLLATKTARLLYGSTRAQRAASGAVSRYIQSPAGRWLRDSGAAAQILGEGAARTAVMRQVAGRNDEQPMQ